jgi:hypothetical protein
VLRNASSPFGEHWAGKRRRVGNVRVGGSVAWAVARGVARVGDG